MTRIVSGFDRDVGNRVKQAAARDGMPYQRFIRLAPERALHRQR